MQRTSSNDGYVSNTAYDVSRNYAVNGLNQYTAAGPATFLYDANGNLTSEPAPAEAGGATNYVYDAENRLVSASGAQNATLQYDPLGRLSRVTGGNGTTWFLYDGDRLLEEYDGAGTRLRAYAHGPGQPAPAEAGEPLIWYELTGGAIQRVLHADHQGSIVGIADSSGNALAINAYDSWGIPNSANQGRFGYTGQTWLPELGIWHYKARIYSPTLGRFLQTDPIAYDDQMNLYAYVRNDPLNATDPDGRRIQWVYTNGGTSAQRDRSLSYLKGAATWTTRYRALVADPRLVTIIVNPTASANQVRSDNSIVWNPSLSVETRSGRVQSPSTTLAHEVDHGHRQLTDHAQYIKNETTRSREGPWSVNEDIATTFSNRVAGELGEPLQKNYGDAVREFDAGKRSPDVFPRQ